ncbi:MAG: UDP-glucose 4-epimerase GalE [Methanobacteriaceae archaeon]|nr:UDP-glucose 4-epimerase GalE [Methanobacteriaceae archaeon]
MILITGGAGYIGSHLNKKASAEGYETVVLDNLIYGHKDFLKWGNFHKVDLADVDALRSIFQKYEIDAVMHFAAFTNVGESVSDPQKYYQNNLKNTINLLQVMLENHVKKFIFSSTCATYGLPNKIPITEDHPQNPINPYGKAKLMVEKILEDYSNAYNLKYVSLRYFNAAGADPDVEIGEWHLPETHLIPLVLDAAMGRRDHVKIFGTDYDTPDGTCIRDYIHVMDLADAHLKALQYLEDEKRSEVFNLGNGNGFSVREVIKKSEKVTGKPISIIETDRRPSDPPVLIGSSIKAGKILNWHPKYKNLEKIIESAWKWHQKIYL